MKIHVNYDLAPSFFSPPLFSSFCCDFQYFFPVWTRVSSSFLNLFAKFCARGRGYEFEEKYLRVKVWTLEMRVFVMSVRLSFGCSSIRLFDVIANQLYMFVHTYVYVYGTVARKDISVWVKVLGLMAKRELETKWKGFDKKQRENYFLFLLKC